MDFRHRKQELLKRAKYTEEKASRVRNAQAQDLMRALAALYREIAEELEDSGLFERRFPPLHFALPARAWCLFLLSTPEMRAEAKSE